MIIRMRSDVSAEVTSLNAIVTSLVVVPRGGHADVVIVHHGRVRDAHVNRGYVMDTITVVIGRMKSIV